MAPDSENLPIQDSSLQGELVDESGQPLVRVQETRMEAHRGPLPSPRTLREYDELYPGLAEKIIGWTEDEMKQRRFEATESLAITKSDVDQTHANEKLGLIIQGVASVSSLFLGLVVSLTGGAWQVAAIFAGAPVVKYIAGWWVKSKSDNSDQNVESGSDSK